MKNPWASVYHCTEWSRDDAETSEGARGEQTLEPRECAKPMYENIMSKTRRSVKCIRH